LKDAKYTGQWSYDDALNLALANRGNDEFGYRNEFVQLIRKAKLAKPANM
jgi:Ca-activated chloride channel family protein